MKTIIILLGLEALLLLGCAHAGSEDIRLRNLNNLQKLEVGMTIEQVDAIMGQDRERVEEAVYYEGHVVGHHPIDVPNPYKRERKVAEAQAYEILYYYADMFGMRIGFWDRAYQERRIADRFLTPLVFHEGRLIGWGREFAQAKHLLEEPPTEGKDSIFWGR